ncbi:MAG: hypothetical protein ACUVR1_08360 [Fimbriimonadales bacterium]
MADSRVRSVPVEQEGKYLRFRWSFTVPMPIEQVRPRLQAYFSKLGYTSAAAEDALVMRRSSLLRSMLIWTPRNLAAELAVRYIPVGEGTQVALELTVDKTGHWVYNEDCELLATELVEAERYLLGEQVDCAAMDTLNRHTAVQLIYVFAITFVLALPLGVVALGLRILM